MIFDRRPTAKDQTNSPEQKKKAPLWFDVLDIASQATFIIGCAFAGAYVYDQTHGEKKESVSKGKPAAPQIPTKPTPFAAETEIRPQQAATTTPVRKSGTVEECLLSTSGVINEAYARCRAAD